MAAVEEDPAEYSAYASNGLAKRGKDPLCNKAGLSALVGIKYKV